MSSHYIIRDDQEPALFIYDADAIKEEAVFSLLEWNPLVIISESAIGFVLNNTIKVDAVVIDRISESQVDTLLSTQYPFDKLIGSDLEKMLLNYLETKGMHGLDIIGGFGDNAIKLASKIEQVYPVTIFSGHIKYIHSKSSFKKWSSPGRGFIIDCPSDDPINTVNLIKQEKGRFKVAKEGQIEITCSCPIWIGEVLF